MHRLECFHYQHHVGNPLSFIRIYYYSYYYFTMLSPVLFSNDWLKLEIGLVWTDLHFKAEIALKELSHTESGSIQA